MALQDLEKEMRALEAFHSQKVLPGAWPIIRVDGRSFSKFTATRFEKPFDEAFSGPMIKATERLVQELGGLYGYTESDEISILLKRDTELFDREQEKLVSVSAGVASSVLSLAFQEEVHCDSRLIVAPQDRQVGSYFMWRQRDATRCALNGWAYWTLRKEGMTKTQATKLMAGKGVTWKNQMLFERGINFNDLPSWQRRGTGVYWETYQKEGFNPMTQQTVTTTRNRLKVDQDLPLGSSYYNFIKRFTNSAGA